ncbi:hypothetical protein HPB47_024695, partial [Ixodes persulcatus]
MMTICAKQETENESLRAKLEERRKFMSYADALRGRVTGTEGTGGPSHLAGASAQEQAHPAALTQTDAVPTRPEHVMLIYFRNPTGNTNACNDIKVLVKKYFNPQNLGMGDVTLKDIREGLAVQSNSLQGLQNLQNAIKDHECTKDILVLRRPNKRKPQFRVMGVDPDILPAEFSAALYKQNPGLVEDLKDIQHRTSYKEKSGNLTHIFEVNPKNYNNFKEENKLRLGWTSCTMSENFYVPRCTSAAHTDIQLRN